jgi:hypothetical protein
VFKKLLYIGSFNRLKQVGFIIFQKKDTFEKKYWNMIRIYLLLSKKLTVDACMFKVINIIICL